MDEGIKKKRKDNKKRTASKGNPGTDFFVSQNSKETDDKGNKVEQKDEKDVKIANKSLSFFVVDPEGKK